MNYSTFYAKLIPNGAASGTKFSISVSGITAIVDGQKTWTSGDLYFSVKPKSSGKATVTFKNDTDGSIIGTKEILVRSTTLANPTYSLTASATTVNEGGSVTFTLDTTDVLPNTNVPYTITGVSVEDISLSSLTGNFKIDSEGFAKLPITIAMDDLDEETESLTVTLNGKSVSKSVSILNVIHRKYNIGLYESTTATTEIDKQIYTNTVSLEVIGTFVKTETYNGKSYDIGWGVNAYDYFVSKIGRAPLDGENISFIVGPNTALVATSTSVGALHFDTRFNNVGSLTVSNSGIVLGRGGTGTYVGSNNRGNPGGTAIVNLSTKPVTVYNTNLVAGGGNGGSGASGTRNNPTGGAGAPWGANTNLSFTTPEPRSPGGGGVYSSAGHNWGDTGKIITGIGSVINQGDGISLGY